MSTVRITYRVKGSEPISLEIETEDPFPIIDAARRRIRPDLATPEAEAAHEAEVSRRVEARRALEASIAGGEDPRP